MEPAALSPDTDTLIRRHAEARHWDLALAAADDDALDSRERARNLLLVADLQIKAGELRSAASSLIAALERDADQPLDVYRRALIVTYEQGDKSVAASCGEAALSRFADDASINAYLGLALDREKPSERGLGLMRHGLALNPNLFGSFYRDFVPAARRAGAVETAIADLRAAVKTLATRAKNSPALASAQLALANLLSDAGRAAELDACVSDVLATNPDLLGSVAPMLYEAVGPYRGGAKPEMPAVVEEHTATLTAALAATLSGWPLPAGESGARGLAVLTYLLARQIDYVSAKDTSEVARARVAEAELSSDFIRILGDGAAAMAQATRSRRDAPAWHDEPHLSDRMKDVIDTATTGSKRVLSPFSGVIGTSEHMLAPDCYLFRENGRMCLVLQITETDAATADTVWLFLEERLCLFLPECKYQPRDLARAIERILRPVQARPDAFAAHVTQPPRAMLAGEFLCPHIGHYIWNCVSGWSSFFAHGAGAKMDAFVVHGVANMLGGVGELYADEPSLAGKEVIALAPGADGTDLILARGAMLLTLKNKHVSSDLADRVVRWSRARCSDDFRARATALKAASQPLVLITIRLDNRSWVEQPDGWIELLHALSADHPRMGVVIDGGNAGLVQGWTHAFMSLDAERAVSQRIVAACGPTMPVFDSIGCTVAESIVLATLADFFIAPVGAGMAKYRWIANLPGVAFSNRTFSDPASFDGRLYDGFRDDARQARHVPAAFIEDRDVRRGDVQRANFSMDWRHLRASVDEFLAASKDG